MWFTFVFAVLVFTCWSPTTLLLPSWPLSLFCLNSFFLTKASCISYALLQLNCVAKPAAVLLEGKETGYFEDLSYIRAHVVSTYREYSYCTSESTLQLAIKFQNCLHTSASWNDELQQYNWVKARHRIAPWSILCWLPAQVMWLSWDIDEEEENRAKYGHETPLSQTPTTLTEHQ